MLDWKHTKKIICTVILITVKLKEIEVKMNHFTNAKFKYLNQLYKRMVKLMEILQIEYMLVGSDR